MNISGNVTSDGAIWSARVGNIGSKQHGSQIDDSPGVASNNNASSIVHLSSTGVRSNQSTYANPAAGAAQKFVTFNFFSFGDTSPNGSASGPTRLEYNVYRPDGIDVEGSEFPYTVKSTGEKLDGDVAAKYRKMLWDVTSQRIQLYKTGIAANFTLEAIRKSLQNFDKMLPDAYKALVGSSDMSDPATRYMMATNAEALGGEVQHI